MDRYLDSKVGNVSEYGNYDYDIELVKLICYKFWNDLINKVNGVYDG